MTLRGMTFNRWGRNVRSNPVTNMANRDGLYSLSVVNLAQAGDLQAIARWLNSCLIPQGIYARVGAAKPGYLKIAVEFERLPERDRLIRLICHRLCKINSSLIQRVQITARWTRTSKTVWVQSVRINTPASRTAKHSLPLLPAAPSTANLKRHAAPVGNLVSQQVRSRSLLLTGSATAAFLVGCGLEVLIQYAGASAQPNPSEASAASVPQPTSERSAFVETAQDKVTVFQHPVLDPDNPTVTLTFGDNAALGTVGATSTLRVSSIERYQSGRADVATTHLDAPLIQVQPSSPEEETAPEQLQALIDNRINVVSLASDRLMTEGATGLEETLQALEQMGIHSVGAGRNRREASRPEILDVKGQRIAYLGYSDSDLNAARDRTAGINADPEGRVAADIRAIRDQVDWVVVNYHWSEDLGTYPTPWQVDLAHLAIDQGADLVVGHHPTVLQGAEIYKGRAIAYSLGNFIFTQSDNTPVSEASVTDYDTAVLKVSLRDRQMRLEFLPVEVRQAMPKIVEGEKATQILQHMQEASSLFAQPMQSPIVLDERSLDPARENIPAEPLAEPAESEPDQPASPESVQPSDSFITYPDAPTDQTQLETVPVKPSSPLAHPQPDAEAAADNELFHAWPDAHLNGTEIKAIQLQQPVQTVSNPSAENTRPVGE
jgi:poly-gamma-glutamate capsule biosynthesis protein CapA/YwtB (metallophosphatase superfamily)